jgi:hypothetical protein
MRRRAVRTPGEESDGRALNDDCRGSRSSASVQQRAEADRLTPDRRWTRAVHDAVSSSGRSELLRLSSVRDFEVGQTFGPRGIPITRRRKERHVVDVDRAAGIVL